jgi:ferrous iron transport protein B
MLAGLLAAIGCSPVGGGGFGRLGQGDIIDAHTRRVGQKAVRAGPGHVRAAAGRFGLLTMTPRPSSADLPLALGFYLLLSLLEDSGYLPRIAALADRSLSAVGLNGRAVIPLILGLGCVTMATLSMRILGSKRERFIATALMAVAVPCSAQLGIVAALMATAAPGYSAAYFGVLIAVFGHWGR